MFRRLPAVITTVLLCSPGLGYASKVKVWHHSLPGDYDKAQLKGVVISNEGALRLAHQLKPLASLDATHVWDIVEDKTGNLFVATGDEGVIYKVAPDGKTTVAFNSEDSQVLCLALAPDGSIFAGTGPSGHLLHIMPDGTTRLIYTCPDSYIWSLVVDPTGETIYAGTGPKGHIYQVTREGKGSVFYATRQDHILSLALGPDGALYAGTDKNGLVYRVDEKGKGFVLFSAPQAEVRCLLVGSQGVYAATSAPRRTGSTTSAVNYNRPSADSLTSLSPGTKTASKAAAADISSSPPPSSATKDKEEKTSPAPAPTPPLSGENSLYRIAADGTVREIFREKTLILSLLRHNSRFFLGTGMDGQLFEVNEATKERSEIARLDHGEVQSLCRRHDGSIVVGAGDPGKLYVLQNRYAAVGTVVSAVLDAKMISKWGALRWKAKQPAGTRVTVAVRSGNLAEPDETWSDWSVEQTDPETAIAASPPARFLQYRVTLTTDNPDKTPILRSLSLRYATKNQAPEVTAIEVPDLDSTTVDNPKKLKLKWTALDPNEDELTYSLFVRKDGWKNWVQLEEALDKREYEWDTTTTPSGMYQVKVVASDHKDNPAKEALTGERISTAFAVAHEPPLVTLKLDKMEGAQAVVAATAADPMVRLTAASYAVNGGKWVNVFPTDGLFDGKTKTFRFQTPPLRPGTQIIVLRVRDAAGNIGSGDLVFPVPTPRAGQ
jgi:WD40 repeat protein